ncbi:tyrosine-type recombinase/integrase [Nostoc sp. 'Peltigera membranacea cyanobiont' N6]|uniref:tyrosine-type recombinase/integrase n=1 Tax=Nostoc sp. 'Peltigera membranacea cyanobiont' N6 TaxID=1261031 RepID=UPI000CF346DC|nr:tyrosine-type recombinase/integrase [Nostoc sp. 'Peltigera membranacea cyanobiont' N6]AVH64121.1 site-specific tyrosine recombinase [Nostoc sp. 'Peltigera membranacea cyanobiont' N6]
MTTTLAQVVTAFLCRQGLAASTLKSYELTLLSLLKVHGSLPVQLVNRQLIKDYLESLDELRYTTHNRHQAIISALFNFAVEEGYIQSNPVGRLNQRKPRRERGEHKTDEIRRYFTPSGLDVLYAGVKKSNARLEAIVYLLHRTGARVGELLSLELSQINFEQRKFQVVGKGNKQRWCFYSEDAESSLQDYIKYYRHKHSTALFTAQHPTTRVITPVSYRTVNADWRKVVDQHEELKETRLHDLRHTFATERVGLMAIEELRALMGHENIQTTLRYQKITSSRAELVAKTALNSLVNSI